jgi:hypothetical protein
MNFWVLVERSLERRMPPCSKPGEIALVLLAVSEARLLHAAHEITRWQT